MKTALHDGTLLLATHNADKVKEFAALAASFAVEIKSAAEFGLPEPDETGASFEENAILKAKAAATATGMAALGDDSGLCVEGLGGEPGIHSARWAGKQRDFDLAMGLVHEKLLGAGANTPDRRHAQFVAVLALALPDGTVSLFRGEVGGEIVWPPRGRHGFGYDAIFQPNGYQQTFAEMKLGNKQGWSHGDQEGLSHRARAFAKFASQCLTRSQQ